MEKKKRKRREKNGAFLVSHATLVSLLGAGAKHCKDPFGRRKHEITSTLARAHLDQAESLWSPEIAAGGRHYAPGLRCVIFAKFFFSE